MITPVAVVPATHPPRPATVFHALVHLGRSEPAALSAVCASAASGVAATITLVIDPASAYAHPVFGTIAPIFFHRISPLFWVAAVTCGLTSASRLVRLLGAGTLATIVLFYGWSALRLPGSPRVITQTALIVLPLCCGLPWLAKRVLAELASRPGTA